MTDRNLKGRQASGDRHGSKTRPERVPRGDRHKSVTKPECLVRGERVNTAKLTEVEVLEIRRIYSEVNISYVKLGVMFNVGGIAISRIINRITWTHI